VRTEDLRPGVVVHVGREASVQFTNGEIDFRIIRTGPPTAYAGWQWLSGYQLNQTGDAVERRDIFVQPEGLRPVPP